ncbi:MAG: ferredoxin--NADP reductase [Chloroflexota bacterium]
MKTKLKLIKVKVLKQREIAPGVFVLSFARPWDFTAGQVVGLGGHETDEARLYSIASGELDDEVDILYNINPDGKLTPWMAQLNTADTLWVSEPFGSFTGSGEPGWWIASGTGIAPFISMFRTGLYKNKKILHGGRNLQSFYFHELFEPELKENYIRCCSREFSPTIYNGRITQYLREHSDLPANEKYYLCGSAEMVVDARDILIEKGIPFENIVSEIYF